MDDLLKRTKEDVRSVLITSKHGFTISEFVKVFWQLTQYSVPYRRLGYASLRDFLEAADDVCCCRPSTGNSGDDGQLVLTAVCDASTSHVQRLVARSRSPTSGSGKRKSGKHAPFSTASLSIVPARCRCNLMKLLARHPQGIYVDELSREYGALFGQPLNAVQLGFAGMRELLDSVAQLVQLQPLPHGLKVLPRLMPVGGGVHNRGSVGVVGKQHCGDGLISWLPNPSSTASTQHFLQYSDTLDPLRLDIIAVLKASASPAVPLFDLPQLFSRHFGRDIMFSDLGFTNLLDAVVQLGPPLRAFKTPNGWYCSLVTSSSTNHRAQHSECPRKLAALVEPSSSPHRGLLNSTDNASCDRHSCPSSPTPSPVARVDDQRSARVHPASVEQSVAAVMCRFTCEPPSLLEHGEQCRDTHGRPLINVLLVSVSSPSFFVYRTSSWHERLHRLRAAMHDAYETTGDASWRQPCQLPSCGLPVSVCLKTGWHRAVVQSILLDQLRVLLVDIGRCESVGSECVYPLPECFMKEPVLCAEASLADVVPPAGQTSWSRGAITQFSALFTPDTAVVASVIRQTSCMSELRLCDTSSIDDVYACSMMIDAGVAVPAVTCLRPASNTPPPIIDSLQSTMPTALCELYAVLDAASVCPRAVEQDSRVQLTSSGLSDISGVSDTSSDQQHATELVQLKAQCYDVQRRIDGSPSARVVLASRLKLRQLERRISQLQFDSAHCS